MADEYIRKQDAIELCNNPLSEQSMRLVPPVDVAPVVHAYWIDTDNYYRRWKCSACSGHTKEAHPQFCPFCGAKMDGKKRK